MHDESRFEEARALLEAYQQERTQRMRDEYEELIKLGQADSMLTSFRHHQLRN